MGHLLGGTPRHAAVCCTDGILRLLDQRELRAALGRELSHVYNRDISTSSVAGGFAAAIAFVAQAAVLFGGNRHRSMNPTGGCTAACAGSAGGVGDPAGDPSQSRIPSRRVNSQLTGDPLALARALGRVDAAAQAHPLAPGPRFQASSHLLIADPFSGHILFSTHPAMRKQIARLEELATESALLALSRAPPRCRRRSQYRA